jgi:hypothetical protein
MVGPWAKNDLGLPFILLKKCRKFWEEVIA